MNNDYSEPFEPENYPNPVDINLLFRSILANEPRVTRYAIDWTGKAPVGVPILDEHDNTVPVLEGAVESTDDDDDIVGDDETEAEVKTEVKEEVQ